MTPHRSPETSELLDDAGRVLAQRPVRAGEDA